MSKSNCPVLGELTVISKALHFHSWLPPKRFENLFKLTTHVTCPRKLVLQGHYDPLTQVITFTWQDVVNAICYQWINMPQVPCSQPKYIRQPRKCALDQPQFLRLWMSTSFLESPGGNLSSWELHGAKHKLHLVRECCTMAKFLVEQQNRLSISRWLFTLFDGEKVPHHLSLESIQDEIDSISRQTVCMNLWTSQWKLLPSPVGSSHPGLQGHLPWGRRIFTTALISKEIWAIHVKVLKADKPRD